MTAEVTANAGKLYEAMRQCFADLNRLAQDFNLALREEEVTLPIAQEYSYSPNALSLKTDHAWLFSRTHESTGAGFTFAAVLVLFEAERGYFKVAPRGRPELWFLFGRIDGLAELKPQNVRSFFENAEKERYAPALEVGGKISLYEWGQDAEKWRAVLVGFEIGDLDSAEHLKQRVVTPLLAEAQIRSLL